MAEGESSANKRPIQARGVILMTKLTLPILTVAATLFAGSASAFDPDDLKRLKETARCNECNLRRADLRYTILYNASLRGADLSRADLSHADLTGANLRGTDLRYAILYKANLDGADLRKADLSYAKMSGAKLCNTSMPDGSVIYSGC